MAGEEGQTHRFLVPGLVFICMVVAVLSSLGAPLIPKVASVDHVSLSDAQWSLTIAFLVSAVATPTMGRLGDGPHRRSVILGGLGTVAAGGVLAALPVGFPYLLAGRGLQGVGLGLTPMAMTVARDVLPPERGGPAVAVLSVTTAAGVGLGYPITGLIAQHGGIHAAFWFGAAVAVAALAVAVVVVPSSAHRPAVRLDVGGAVMLGAALTGLLLAMSEGESWGWTSIRLAVIVPASILVLAGWVVLELRSAHPLVELHLLRQIAVLTADATGLLTGIGMYVLLSLVTRFVQTPSDTGYGLGASVAVAGLVLVPFSVGSVAANRVTPALARWVTPRLVLPIGSVVMLVSAVMFTVGRGSLWQVGTVMGVAGLGVGVMFAAMPAFIVRSVPLHETGSAMSFNQVLRYIGYGIGSTVSAVILQAHTPAGHSLPTGNGYTTAGLACCLIWIVTAAVSLALPTIRSQPARSPSAGEVALTALLGEESLASAVPYESDDESGPNIHTPEEGSFDGRHPYTSAP